MKLTFKKLKDNAIIPSRATSASAGLDISACLDEPVTLEPGDIKMIPVGITAEPDCDDVALLIYPRSGLSTKFGVTLANCVGVVDSDYRGELCVLLRNFSNTPYTIENGERIAQLMITDCSQCAFTVVDELSETERGEGGFGSTGKQ